MDLAVFGASFAAGFAAGKTFTNSYDVSYPRLIAAKLNVDNYYNFSIPARSITSTKNDIIDFAENYIAINKSPNDLFILGELCDPKYISVPTVVGTDNKIYKPTILINRHKPISTYRHMYCEMVDYSKIINDPNEVYATKVLSPNELPLIIAPETIDYIKNMCHRP